MILTVIHILFYILFVYLSINVAYLFMLAVSGLFYRRRKSRSHTSGKRIALLITTYREDSVIVHTVRNAVMHDYPAECFDVFVAAHRLQPDTLSALRATRANIYEVDFERGSKARALNFLLNTIDASKYDIAVVLDGDNVMKAGFLKAVDAAFEDGYSAVQGHRTAKNLHTPVAILDAWSEEINNHLFRRAPASMGLSSSLIGSGMAFRFNDLKRIYNKPGILDNPACDREVDFEMLKSGIRILYLDDAYVLDEKVSSKHIYQNQRRRWLESQAMHVQLFIREKIKNKNADFWHKLFINLIPPRLLMLAIFFVTLCICAAQYFSARTFTGIANVYWLSLFGLYVFSLIISTPSQFFNVPTLKAILYLPTLAVSLLKAAFTVKFNRKEFTHTPKTYTGNPANTEE